MLDGHQSWFVEGRPSEQFFGARVLSWAESGAYDWEEFVQGPGPETAAPTITCNH